MATNAYTVGWCLLQRFTLQALSQPSQRTHRMQGKALAGRADQPLQRKHRKSMQNATLQRTMGGFDKCLAVKRVATPGLGKGDDEALLAQPDSRGITRTQQDQNPLSPPASPAK
jgi:hypothetical protein